MVGGQILFVGIESRVIRQVRPLFTTGGLGISPMLLYSGSPRVSSECMGPSGIFVTSACSVSGTLRVMGRVRRGGPISNILA